MRGHSSGQFVYKKVNTTTCPFWSLRRKGLSLASVSWKSGEGNFSRSVPCSLSAGLELQAIKNRKPHKTRQPQRREDTRENALLRVFVLARLRGSGSCKINSATCPYTV